MYGAARHDDWNNNEHANAMRSHRVKLERPDARDMGFANAGCIKINEHSSKNSLVGERD
jgi:hypothetical protein